MCPTKSRSSECADRNPEFLSMWRMANLGCELVETRKRKGMNNYQMLLRSMILRSNVKCPSPRIAVNIPYWRFVNPTTVDNRKEERKKLALINARPLLICTKCYGRLLSRKGTTLLLGLKCPKRGNIQIKKCNKNPFLKSAIVRGIF